MNKKLLSVLHFVLLILVIYWNYLSNTGFINGKTVGNVSDSLNTLFTPAGFTFAIWGVIYLALIVLGIYLIRKAFSDDHDNIVESVSYPLMISYVGNATWIWLWLMEYIGASVLVMFVILASLVQLVLKLRMELWDAPTSLIANVWWPIDIYFGWICVATIANISAYLGGMGWTGGMSETTWAIIAIALAVILTIFLVFTRNMREVAAVVIWALFGIASRHAKEVTEIAQAAQIGIIILAIITSIHAFQNRSTLPFVRKFYER